MTKKQREKLNSLYGHSIVGIALDHSCFEDHAIDHWKDFLNTNYKDPAEWAEENLSPDEISDLIAGMKLVGADYKIKEKK